MQQPRQARLVLALFALQTHLVRHAGPISDRLLSPSETFQISLVSLASRSCRCRVDSRYHCYGQFKMPLTERDVNIPHKTRTQTPPAHKTPQPHSKLPRFVATPNSAPAASKWTPRTSSPAESVERTASALRHTAVNRNLGVATTTSGQKV